MTFGVVNPDRVDLIPKRKVLIKTIPIFDQIDTIVSKQSKLESLNQSKADEFHCLMFKSKLQCTQDSFNLNQCITNAR